MPFWSYFKSGLGSTLAHATTILCLPIITRLYSPSDLAIWALGIAVLTFLVSIATFRYDLAVIIERHYRKASAIFWLISLLSLGVFSVTCLSILFLSKMNWMFNGSQVSQSAFLVALWLFILLTNQVLQVWCLYNTAYLIISISQISNAIIVNSIQIGGAQLANGGAFWLIVGSIFGQISVLVILSWHLLHNNYIPVNLKTCTDLLWKMAVKYRNFVYFSLPYTIFSVLKDRAAIIYIGSVGGYGNREIGFYSLAYRLSNVPAGLTGSALRPVLFNGAAKNGLAKYERHIGRILLLFVSLGSPLLAFIIHRPEDLFGFILGESWKEIGPLIAVFVFPGFVYSMNNWMDRLIDYAGKQHLNLITQMVNSISSLVGLAIALYLGASLLEASIVQASILVVNYLFLIFLTYKVAHYHTLHLLWLFGLSIVLFSITNAILPLIW